VTDQPGRLSITLRHVATAFLYNATSPRQLINSADMRIPGWGRTTSRSARAHTGCRVRTCVSPDAVTRNRDFRNLFLAELVVFGRTGSC
jgi:hypothetical protein